MPNLMWGCLSKRHTVEQKTSCELFSLYTVAPLGTLFSQVQQVLLNFELAMTSVTVVSDTAAADASFLFTVESALNSTSSKFSPCFDCLLLLHFFKPSELFSS